MAQMENTDETSRIMHEYMRAADTEIAATIARLDHANERTDTPETVITPLVDRVGSAIAHLIADQIEISLDESTISTEVSQSITTPPSRSDYPWPPDFGLPVQRLARAAGIRNPVELATQIGTIAQHSDMFSEAGSLGPFVNLQVSETVLITEAQQIINNEEVRVHNDKVVLVDFSSPNIAKPFGINHLRSTIIGESIARIKEEAGYTVVRANHLGDWGTQFGNLLAAYDQFGDGRPFEELTTDELTELYVRFSTEKKDNPELIFIGREYFHRLSEKDPELLQRWNIAVKASRQEFSEVYERLGINFDIQVGEAYFEQSAEKLLADLEANPEKSAKSNIIFGEDGTAYINGEHPVMLRTQDGYCVYAARDLATVDMRTTNFKPSEIVYVVGEEQSSSFAAMFETARQLEINGDGVELTHADFGLLLGKDRKKLSTRKGTSGKLIDLLNELEERSHENLKERNANATEESLQKNSEILALDALIWNDLQTDRKKSVIFDPERMLSLGKGGVIDALYACLRSAKIVEKMESMTSNEAPPNYAVEVITNRAEHDLIISMSEYQNVIKHASDTNSPHVLVTYLQNLSRRHGVFYEQSPVARETDETIRNSRIALHQAFLNIMEKGLTCLNITVPDYL